MEVNVQQAYGSAKGHTCGRRGEQRLGVKLMLP